MVYVHIERYIKLISGVSISGMLLALKHMGMSIYDRATFFRHQNQLLFPSILGRWKTYQRDMYQEIKEVEGDIEWSGDGRFDSMGHSAKYGAYTMYCNTISKLVHFELVQVLFRDR